MKTLLSLGEVYTASLGNLCQWLVILAVTKLFLRFRWYFLGFSLCPLTLILSLGTLKEALLHPLHLHGASLVSLQCVHVSCIEKPRTERATPCMSSAVLSREGSPHLTLCDSTPSCSPEYSCLCLPQGPIAG